MDGEVKESFIMWPGKNKQWNLYYVDTFGTFPSVHLTEGVRLLGSVKIAQCFSTINIQWLLSTVIKFHVVKEAKESLLYFVQDF